MDPNHQEKHHSPSMRSLNHKNKVVSLLLLTQSTLLIGFMLQNLGVDIDQLLISQPDNGEQALEIAENLIRSGAIDIIVIDSRRCIGSKKRNRRRNGRFEMGLQARLMSQALRKLTATIGRTGCCCIFINQ